MSTVGHSTEHLEAGQLGTADVTASTVANIGPGIDFYFAFGGDRGHCWYRSPVDDPRRRDRRCHAGLHGRRVQQGGAFRG
ncbi:MAG TPA: hypothetical protein VK721_06470 [Solirubrobacteraceae bacterium]|nr:hypothetical protein [Solirubrobacteraceae bacterium]